MPSQRASRPSTWPQALSIFGSQEEAIPTRIGGAVVWRTCGPDSTLIPCASAQHSAEIAGVVPVGARLPPIVVHGSEFDTNGTVAIPCMICAAFRSSVGVGGLSGSSWAISRLTSGVNGASDAIGGDVPGAGSAACTLKGTGSALVAAGPQSAIAAPASATDRPRFTPRIPHSPWRLSWFLHARPGGCATASIASRMRRVRGQRHPREVDRDGTRGGIGGARSLIAPGRVEVVVVEGDRGEVVVAGAVAARRGCVADLQRSAEPAPAVERDRGPVVVGARHLPEQRVGQEGRLRDRVGVERLVADAEHAPR